MDIAFICGMYNLELSDYGDYHFILAQEARRHKAVRAYYKESEMYKTLDNGTAEKSRVPFSILVDMANEIDADEVVAPDVVGDIDETIDDTSAFLSEYSNEPFEVMGVPQGSTGLEWFECLDWMLKNDNIHSIGLSRLSIPMCFPDVSLANSRLRCLQAITQAYSSETFNKPIHLLGCSEPAELRNLYVWLCNNETYEWGDKNLSWLEDTIRSVDTMTPFILGLKDLTFDNKGHKPDDKKCKVAFNTKPTVAQTVYILKNMLSMYRASEI